MPNTKPNSKLPAIAGGSPTRKTYLTFGQPHFAEEDIDEIVHTLRSGWVGTGPKTHIFEKQFSQFINAQHALALNSCTAGLFLALKVLGVGEGDQVITTAITFPATANVIEHVGATPIFVDIDPNTWNIDPQKIAAAITPKTKALIPVHLHGRPADMKPIHHLAKLHNLYIIEDAAHAIETKYQTNRVGQGSDFAVFSFYATKNLTTAEGGMLISSNKEYINQARILSLHGLDHDAWNRYGKSDFKHYQTMQPGYKFNMTDLQASLGIHQLKRLQANHRIRRQHWNQYQQAFKNHRLIKTPAPFPKGTTHAYHLYAILIATDKLTITRDEFLAALQAENIGTGVHYTCLPLHQYYQKKYSLKPSQFPNAYHYSERAISLPLSPHLTSNDIQDVITAIIKLFDYFAK